MDAQRVMHVTEVNYVNTQKFFHVGLGKHFDHAVGFVNHYTQRDKPIA